MDQPSMDGLNTWFISKATREAGLKVAFSGLGGDEILAGYTGFSAIPRCVSLLGGLKFLPGLGQGIRRLGLALKLASTSPKALGVAEYGGTYPGAYLLYRGLMLPFELQTSLDPELIKDGLRRLSLLTKLSANLRPDPGSPIGRVSALDSCQYMRNQLLRDSDWSSMAHSIEVRTPLVDSKLLSDLAPMIPHFHARTGKNALAQAPSIALPADVRNREKTGFVMPMQQWMESGTAEMVGARLARGLVSRQWAARVFHEFDFAV